MRLFDTHCHIADEDFDQDREEVISRMKENHVDLAVVVSDVSQNPERGIDLAKKNGFLYSAVGLHPHEASRWSPEMADRLKALLSEEKVAALGEIGLDYHYDLSPRDVQRSVFDEQLDIAAEKRLPTVLHIREAHQDAGDILKSRFSRGNLPPCVMHCYSGSWETAKVYIDMGLYISFTGVITFSNARKLAQVAKNAPLDRILIETDCPYMAPVPLRGKRNEPSYVLYVMKTIARIREMDVEELSEATFENGKRFFGIS